MRTRRAARFGLVVLAVAAVALLTRGETSWTSSTLVAASSAAARAPNAPTARLERRPRRAHLGRRMALRRLSLQQLAGQRIIYAFAGTTPPRSLLAAIRAGEAGGVIFFEPNVTSGAQLRSITDELQRASLASPVHAPLLMLTDQEGGNVRRLPGAPLLSEKQIGQSSNSLALAASAGAGAGRNLAGAGVNVNLAPVLDVFRAPGDFIDEFGRSYSSDARTAASLGAAFIVAQQRGPVAATAKHFPGLGAATRSENTDEAPVTLRVPLATLRAVDEAPYREAIAAGVRLVMSSWAIYPALDPRRPAGLSPAVVDGELRGRLGFRGVTITDGIEAGALAPFGGLGRRAVLAASAGADLILCASTNAYANTPALGIAARNALASALAQHRLRRVPAEQAAGRILALRGG